MPIRPENAARYPKDWKTVVVPRIRARSGNRCECTGQCGIEHPVGWWNGGLKSNRCGIANSDVSYMTPDGKWHGCNFYDEGEEMERIDGKVYRAVKIVLTVAHLNHRPEDCDDGNLLHACQGCHLRYDAPRKHREMKERRRAQRAAGDLFERVE